MSVWSPAAPNQARCTIRRTPREVSRPAWKDWEPLDWFAYLAAANYATVTRAVSSYDEPVRAVAPLGNGIRQSNATVHEEVPASVLGTADGTTTAGSGTVEVVVTEASLANCCCATEVGTLTSFAAVVKASNSTATSPTYP